MPRTVPKTYAAGKDMVATHDVGAFGRRAAEAERGNGKRREPAAEVFGTGLGLRGDEEDLQRSALRVERADEASEAHHRGGANAVAPCEPEEDDERSAAHR